MTGDEKLVEQSFDTGEVMIKYMARPGTGNPLLLLHGGTMDWHTFDEFMPTFLSRSNPIYVPNFRGGGGSGWADSYRVIDMARDMAKFMADRIGEPATIIGYSAGASVAIQLAATVPDLVAAAILLEPPLAMRELTWPETANLADDDVRPTPSEYLNWVYETIQGNPTTEEVMQRLRDRERDIGLPAPDELQADVAGYKLLDPKMVDDLINDRDSEGFDIGAAVREIRCPALLFGGEPRLGGVVRDSDLEFFESTVPEATTVQIPDVGHGLVWGDPGQAVLGHVIDFLESHPRRGPDDHRDNAQSRLRLGVGS